MRFVSFKAKSCNQSMPVILRAWDFVVKQVALNINSPCASFTDILAGDSLLNGI